MPSSIANTRAQNLDNGVNLSHWFWNPYVGNQIQTIQSYITNTDIAMIKNMGMDHVRLPVDVSNLMSWNAPSALNSQMLSYLDDAISRLQNAGLSVIVTPFGDFEQKVLQPQYLDAAKSFWTAFAGHLSKFDVSKTFLEVANEPIAGPATWNPIQESLIQAIRAGAPENTIITATYLKYGDGANDWGAVKGLTSAPLSADSNVIYNLHFYEPFFFTHQGASWSDPVAQMMKGLPYNATPSSVEGLAKQLEPLTAGTSNWWVPQWVRDYGAQTFSANDLEKLIAPAAQWASQNNVPLLFNEFGVFKDGGVNPADRQAYLYDLRVIMQEQNINWTAWDWAAGFGMVVKNAQLVPQLDVGTVAALGLDTSLTGSYAEVRGTTGNDALSGGAGVDNVYGGLGHDTIRGGVSADTLFGSAGADRYVFKAGDGKDTVSEFGGDISQDIRDSIVLESVTSMTQVSLTRVADHLVIRYGSGDEITVFNHFDLSTPSRRVEVLELGNGEQWSLNTTGTSLATKIADATPAPAPVPTPANTSGQILNGSNSRDTITGGSGNDTIKGFDSNDSLSGGGGNDTIDGGNGTDTLNGGEGNDMLLGGAGRDYLTGGAGSDILNAGEGTDTLIGGDGNDRFQFNNLSLIGKDTIEDFKVGQDVIDFSGTGLTYAALIPLMADWGADLRLGNSTWSVVLRNVDFLSPTDVIF